jgi:hypothetical protein
MTLTNLHVLLAMGTVFGLIGFLRGVAREIITTVGIIIAYLVIVAGESFLLDWTNKFHKLAVFALRGGLTADDPTAIWPEVRDLPALIETDGEKLIFRVFVFVLLVVLAYIVGNRLLSSRAATFGPLAIYPGLPIVSRLLGLTAGLIDGYLIAYFVIPEVFPEGETIIRLPTGTVAGFLSQNVVFVFIGFVVVLIVYGLRSASLKK